MKKILSFNLPLVLFFVVIFTHTGCATTLAATNKKENNSNNEKLHFDDWKYKGFGSELPIWIEPAISDKIDIIKKIIPEFSEKEIFILIGNGMNSDHAERKLESKTKNMPEGFVLYDTGWVRMTGKKNNSEPDYIAVAIYYR